MQTTLGILGRSMGFRLGMALVVIALIALGFAGYRSAEAGNLAGNGALIEGEVIEKWTNEVRRRSGNVTRYDTEWNVRYRYSPRVGDPIEAERAIPRQLWESLARAGPIAVRYLPDAPERHELVGDESRREVFAFLAGGAAFAVAGLGLIAVSGLAAARTGRILAHGVEHEAEVVSIERGSGKSGPRDPWRIRYRFVDDAGKTHTRIADPAKARAGTGAKPPEIGSRITILVDPSRPSESRWINEI